MSDPTITCPHCHTEIKLTESLAAPLLAATRERYEHELAAKDHAMAKRETELTNRQAELSKAQAALEDTLAERLKTERAAIAAEEGRKAKALMSVDLESRDTQLAELNALLTAATPSLPMLRKFKLP